MACGPQQAAPGITEVTFERVGGPRQARHVVAVQQAGPIAPADLVEMTANRIEGRRDIGPSHHRVERAAQLFRHVLSTHRLGGRGFYDVRAVAEPGGPLSERLAGLRKGGQGRLETLVQLGEARLRARGEEVETQAGHVLEPLGGLHTSQPKGRPAFERAPRAGMAKELCDDLIGFGLWRRAGVPRRWAVGGGRRGLGERTWHQAGPRQDACVAGRRAGFLTDHVADLRAHALSQHNRAGCLGLGEGCG